MGVEVDHGDGFAIDLVQCAESGKCDAMIATQRNQLGMFVRRRVLVVVCFP